MLLVALGGRPVVEIVRVGLTGNRLGDCVLLSAGAGRAAILLASLDSAADDRPYLLLVSAGVRRDRVLEGIVDMVAVLYEGKRTNKQTNKQ
jgi:hypothetical protein